jgi:hypothetical protein
MNVNHPVCKHNRDHNRITKQEKKREKGKTNNNETQILECTKY